MGTAYRFVSTWRLPAPPARCWAELERMLRSGAAPWWPGVTATGLDDELAAGDRLVLQVRSPLGYRLSSRLRVTEVIPGRAIAAASAGDLRGDGRLELAETAGGSVLTIRWDVSTERAWMNGTAFLLRPAFERAHARVMARGERGLRAVLRSP